MVLSVALFAAVAYAIMPVATSMIAFTRAPHGVAVVAASNSLVATVAALVAPVSAVIAARPAAEAAAREAEAEKPSEEAADVPADNGVKPEEGESSEAEKKAE